MQAQVAEGILMQEQDGDAFLLHTGSGRYFSLNRTGVAVWRALEAGADPVEALGERWPDVPLEVRRRDAEALIERLRGAGLVTEPPAEA
ncbi:MAG: PqqD family protein [Actinomycetota bacterium]